MNLIKELVAYFLDKEPIKEEPPVIIEPVISEPVITLLNYLKDSKSWVIEVVNKPHSLNYKFTGHNVSLEISYYSNTYPWVLLDIDWATKDERKAIVESLLYLKNEYHAEETKKMRDAFAESLKC